LFEGTGWRAPERTQVEKPGQVQQGGAFDRDQPLTRRLPIWVLMAVLFTMAMINYSKRVGRLLAAPTYDDVNYMIDAAKRIQVFDLANVYNAVKHWIENPPHSPGETLLAMLGFSIFGIHDWAAYAANVLIILGLLLGANILLKDLHLIERIAIALFLLSVPIAGICVTEFRPDCAAGLATAMAILLTLREGALQTHGQRLGVGLLWAGALLMKPSIFPLTLGLCGLSLALYVCIRWLGEGIRVREAIHWQALVPVVATAFVLTIPHYISACRHILSYIHVNVIGAKREVWSIAGDWAVQLLYFWSGTGGEVMLYNHTWVLAPLLLLGATAVLYRGKRLETIRLLAMALIIAVAYAVPSVNPVKNWFFASAFVFLVILCSAMMLNGLFRYTSQNPLKKMAMRFLALGVIFTSLLLARGPDGLFGRGATQSTKDILTLQRIQRQIDEAIYLSRREAAPVLFCTTGGYSDASTLVFLSMVRGLELIGNGNYTETDLSIYRRNMQAASFILATEPGTGFVHEWLPSANVQEQTLAMAREMTEFGCIAEVPAKHGKRFFLFGRKEQFHGFDTAVGLDEPEGPYKSRFLPISRWGLWPATELKLTCETAEERNLHMTMWTNLDGQEIRIVVNGNDVQRLELMPDKNYNLSRASVPISLKAGENTVELRYSSHHSGLHNDPRLLSVLFTRLAIEP
jgi:hypothetical protein